MDDMLLMACKRPAHWLPTQKKSRRKTTSISCWSYSTPNSTSATASAATLTRKPPNSISSRPLKSTFEDIKFPQALSPDDIINTTFIPKKENLILYGNVGAGKTHLAIAIGVAACDAGFRTRFWRTPVLVNALTEAKRQGTLSRFMKHFDKLDLLICDEWGYVPIDSDGSKLLFQVVSECYERKSLIITTNLEFARWNDIFADTKITAALLDRIIHHSHLLDFSGRDSRRLMDALLNRAAATA